MGCHALFHLFQGIFLTQGSNPCLMSPALAGRFFTTSAPMGLGAQQAVADWGWRLESCQRWQQESVGEVVDKDGAGFRGFWESPQIIPTVRSSG